MTKEDNFDNDVVIDQINMMIDKLSCGCRRFKKLKIYHYEEYKRMENDMFRCFQLCMHINAFKLFQEHNGIFLDLEENEVIRKYCETYPKGAHFLDFFLMICSMTKEENIFNNKVVRKQINLMKKDKLRITNK